MMSPALLVVAACSGAPPAESTTPAATAEVAAAVAPSPDADGLGWVTRVAYEPQSFAALTERSKDGWVALHANDLRVAVGEFGDDKVGRARAAVALAVLYEDLSRISGLAADALFSQWSSKGGLPAGNDAPLVAGLASACTGGESAGVWGSKVKDGPDAPIGQAMVQGRNPIDAGSPGPYGRRMAIHREVKASGDPTPLLAAATTPIATVTEKTFERKFWDPCVYSTLSTVWVHHAANALGSSGWKAVAGFAKPSAGLGGTFLAPWPTGADLEAELAAAEPAATAKYLGLLGARGPTMRRLGVSGAASPNDDPERARTEVETLDAGLDAWSKKILDQAPEEGRAVVSELGLVKRFRQEWLASRARLALSRRHPRIALTFAELARDHATSAVGPANGPSLYALAVEAQLRLGHTREALDLLHVLVAAHPEAIGLEETMGDLAVLQGLARHGDSKEDP